MYLLASAITPVVIFLYLIYNQDTLKEPLGLIFKCFVGGIISIIPAIVIEMVLKFFGSGFTPYPLLSSLYNAFVVAGFSEELVKFVFLYLIIWKSKEFDQHYDGIIYAVAVSLGFACLENILYVTSGGFGVAIVRSVLSVPLHGFCGVFMGYFFALARFSGIPQRRDYLVLSLLIPILLHGLFDFFLMYLSAATLSIGMILIILVAFTVFIIFLWRLGLKHIKKHIEKDKLHNNEQM